MYHLPPELSRNLQDDWTPFITNHNDSGSWVIHRQKQRRTVQQLGKNKITVMTATNSSHNSTVNRAEKWEYTNMLFTGYQKVQSCTSENINKPLLPPDRWRPIRSFRGARVGVQPLPCLGVLLITGQQPLVNHRRSLMTPRPAMLRGHGGSSSSVLPPNDLIWMTNSSCWAHCPRL